MIGWRKLVVTTALATGAAIILDKCGVIEWIAKMIP